MRVEPRPRLSSFPWHTSYLTVAVLSLGLLGGFYYVVPEFGGSTGLVAAGLVVGLFTVTSLLHWYDVTINRVAQRR